jgi:hypothetical protein
MIVMIGATLNATVQYLIEGKIDEKPRPLEHVIRRMRGRNKNTPQQ